MIGTTLNKDTSMGATQLATEITNYWNDAPLYMSRRKSGLICALLFLLSGCSPPPGYKWDDSTAWPFDYSWSPGLHHPGIPHIAAADHEGMWRADPGYRFVNTDSSDLTVQWSPGTAHPDYRHVVAANEEGAWNPDPGYIFISPPSLQVRWNPGQTRSDYPHISADNQEGIWRADAGYVFRRTDDLAVQWNPGQSHPNIPHISAYWTEGSWIANPGYHFQQSSYFGPINYDVVQHLPLDPSMKLVWIPNEPNRNCPQLVSGAQPDFWTAAHGYHLVSSNSLDVVRDPPASASKASIIGKGIVAVLAYLFSRPQKDDGFLTSAGRKGAELLAEHEVESAVHEYNDLYGQPVLTCDLAKLPAVNTVRTFGAVQPLR